VMVWLPVFVLISVPSGRTGACSSCQCPGEFCRSFGSQRERAGGPSQLGGCLGASVWSKWMWIQGADSANAGTIICD